MATQIEKVGSRLYAANAPFAAKDQLKRLGCHWDGNRRQWWIGAAKRGPLEALVAEINGGAGGAVMVATAGSAAVAESLGLDASTPAGIVADRLDDAGRAKEAANVRAGKPAKQDPHDIRLTGKGRYKGREYYAGSVTRDGLKVRLLTLPDASGDYLDFWVLCSLVEQTKTYTPREVWDGRRYSNSTVTKYTTLGSIADFIARQKRDAATGHQRVQCHECDAWHDASESCPECGGC
jgi:hypothetical protein